MIQHYDLSIPVYEKLREMIFGGELKPGEKLRQEKLASQLGVSRTPLLKALQMLEYDFLVESIPRKGMVVKKLSVSEMMDIYDVREGIESVAVRLVALRATPEQVSALSGIWKPFEGTSPISTQSYQLADERFHAMLLDFSGNGILRKIYSHSFIQARIIQMGLMRPPEETLSEHLRLVDAIAGHDPDRAESELKNHLRRSKALIEANYK